MWVVLQFNSSEGGSRLRSQTSAGLGVPALSRLFGILGSPFSTVKWAQCHTTGSHLRQSRMSAVTGIHRCLMRWERSDLLRDSRKGREVKPVPGLMLPRVLTQEEITAIDWGGSDQHRSRFLCM